MTPRTTLSAAGTPTTRRRSRGTAVLVALALLAAPLLAIAGPAPSASAAARLSVTSPLGGVSVSAEGPTTITVSGSGFQSVQGGFGGVYVLFGWVEPNSWRPSQGGRTGEHYLYVPDSEARDNAGYQRFVAFPGSSTAEAANGGVLAADGTFSFQMVIPGPRFAARDRQQNIQEVDCLQVTCGIITVGAHGVVNASNETFTPLDFVGSSGAQAGGSQAAPTTGGGQNTSGQNTSDQNTGGTGQAGASVGQDSSAGDASTDAGETDGSVQDSEPAPDEAVEASDEAVDAEEERDAVVDAARSTPATVGLDQGTIVAGRVVAFTGRGFAPGEQVMATLGGGHAVVGPLTAGEYGEVVGTFALAPDLRAGTYVIRLSGAASGETPQANITVVDDPNALAAGDTPDPVDPIWPWVFVIAVVLGGLLLILIVTGLISAIRRRRAARSAATPDGTSPAEATTDPTTAATSDPRSDSTAKAGATADGTPAATTASAPATGSSR